MLGPEGASMPVGLEVVDLELVRGLALGCDLDFVRDLALVFFLLVFIVESRTSKPRLSQRSSLTGRMKIW